MGRFVGSMKVLTKYTAMSSDLGMENGSFENYGMKKNTSMAMNSCIDPQFRKEYYKELRNTNFKSKVS